MGKRGPVPKAKRLAGLKAPAPPAGEPDKPEWLSAEASAEWDRVLPQLLTAGTLSRIDRSALAAYCQSWSDVVALTAQVEKDGRTWDEPIQSAAGAVVGHRIKPHPAVRQLEAASARMRQYLIEFGLTPAARARMGADVAAASKVEAPPSKLGEIAARVTAARQKAPPKKAKGKGQGKAEGQGAAAG